MPSPLTLQRLARLQGNSTRALIGIDIGGTSAKISLLAPGGRFSALPNIQTQTLSPAEVVGKLAAAIQSALQSAGTNGAPCPAGFCGIGFPGIVSGTGRVVGCPNLKPWIGLELGAEMSRLLSCPTGVYNDANAAALAEAQLGSDKPVANLLFLTLGTGVGSGIVSSGTMLAGTNGFGGEGGHVTVDPDGEPCGCGRRGCLEAHFSETALTSLARKSGKFPPGTGARELFDGAKAGQPEALSLIRQGLDRLAIGISNLCTVLDPDEVVLGGGISLAGPFLLEELQPCLAKRMCYPGWTAPRVRLSELGSEAGALGLLCAGAPQLQTQEN
jgi:glucokinase